MTQKKKQKEFWTFDGVEYCNMKGVATLASKMTGGRIPSETTIRKWLANGLKYHAYISRSYTFKVSTVKTFLQELDKPNRQENYTGKEY